MYYPWIPLLIVILEANKHNISSNLGDSAHPPSGEANTRINQTKYVANISLKCLAGRISQFSVEATLHHSLPPLSCKFSKWRIADEAGSLLLNKWDLFLGILSLLSSFQTLITQFWNCRDRKVSLIQGFHRSKSNSHNKRYKPIWTNII